jgi:hypothetical protein
MNEKQLKFFKEWFAIQEDYAYLKGEKKWIGVHEEQLIILIETILKIK